MFPRTLAVCAKNRYDMSYDMLSYREMLCPSQVSPHDVFLNRHGQEMLQGPQPILRVQYLELLVYLSQYIHKAFVAVLSTIERSTGIVVMYKQE